MPFTFVLNKDDRPLMPTANIKKVRKLLKTGKAAIVKHDPFTIQLLYETTDGTQPVEVCEDTGYQHIGISVKSGKHEYAHEERTMLSDEKQRHEDQVKKRRARRNRKRYRRPHWNGNKHEGWLPPSLQHKADLHLQCLQRYASVCPITSITMEMGCFDTQVLKAVEKGLPIPEGLDYQHGDRYGFDTLREAVFQRDGHTCQVCGKSAITGKAILQVHHVGFWKRDHSDRLDNLLAVCTKCHTPKNHKPGGKLHGLDPEIETLKEATFMNTVRWHIYSRTKEMFPGIPVNITYGAVTKRTRNDLGIEKSHANDAYCMGAFRPRHKARLKCYQKMRRNNRCMEKFYDAIWEDARDGSEKKGSEIGCNRIKRKVPRNNENNLRKFHKRKIKKGYRSIRRTRYPLQSGDVVIYNGKRYTSGGCQGYGRYVVLKGLKKSVKTADVIPIFRNNGWKQT